MTSTTFFIIFIPILAILLLAINLILAPHNPYQEKDSAFECGFHSFLGQNRTQFNISFFIFGLLFLLFDLEILLVYPYSVSSYTNDIYGLVIMIVFFVLLTLGFIFELGKNALTIDSRQTSWYNNGDAPRSANTLLSIGWIQAVIINFNNNKYIKRIFRYSGPCFDLEIGRSRYIGLFFNLLYTLNNCHLLCAIKKNFLDVIFFLLVLSIPYYLKIDVFNYIITLIISVAMFIILFHIISSNSYSILNPTFLSVVFSDLESKYTYIVNESVIPDNLTCVLFFIGIAMVINNFILMIKHPRLFNLIKYYINNIKLIVCLVIIFSLLNMFMVSILNINIINTSSIILFILTAFTKIVWFKLIFIFINYMFTNNISIDMFSMSAKHVLFVIVVLYLNIFWIFPVIGAKIFLHLNNLKSIVHTIILDNNININSFMIQLNKVLSSNPIFHRLILIISSIKVPLCIDRYSPFRIVFTDLVKHNFVTLTKLNKFLPFYSYRPFIAQHTINMEFNCKLSNTISLIYDNSINFKNAWLNLANKYTNLNCGVNIMCSDYNTNISLQIRDGSLKDFQVNSVKTKYSYFNNIFDFSKNELYNLKYNNNPCKDLLEYRVHMMELDQTSNSTGIFKANTVTDNAPAYYNDDHKIEVLKSIEDDLYTYCMHRFRCMSFINNNKIFTIDDFTDQNEIMKLLPESFLSIYNGRADIYAHNYSFDYRKSNLLIYMCLQDLLGNIADPQEIRGQNKQYSIKEDIDPYVVKWLDLCGVDWLLEEERNFPAYLDNYVYNKHIHPYKDEVPLTNNTLQYNFVHFEYLQEKQNYIYNSKISSEAKKKTNLDAQVATGSDIDAEGETDPEFS